MDSTPLMFWFESRKQNIKSVNNSHLNNVHNTNMPLQTLNLYD